MDEFSGQDVIVGGYGQVQLSCSQGQEFVFFSLEVDTNYILHVDVLVKRHVGLVSTNMEREGVIFPLRRYI